MASLTLMCNNVYGQVEHVTDRNYRECLDKDTSIANMYNCAFEAYAKWDKEMDREFKKLLKSVRNDKDRAAVKSAQASWVAYRDNEFKAYDNIFNHPGYNWALLRANSRIELVRTRTLQLQQYNEAFEKRGRQVLK